MAAEYTDTLDGGRQGRFSYTTTMHEVTAGKGGRMQQVTTGDSANPTHLTYLWNASGLSLSRLDVPAMDLQCLHTPAQRIAPVTLKKGDRWQQTITIDCTTPKHRSTTRRAETATVVSIQPWSSPTVGTILTATIRRTITTTSGSDQTMHTPNGDYKVPPSTSRIVQTDVVALKGGFLIQSDSTTTHEDSDSSCRGDCGITITGPKREPEVKSTRLNRVRWAS